MTVPVWQPGTTYAPGALVVPRSGAAPTFTGLTNADLSLTTGWDLATPLQILNDGAGYNGQGRIAAQGTTAGALALNQAHVPVNPGQVVSASAMCAHGTSDDHSSDAGLTIVWYNSSDVEVGTPADGDGVPRLSNAGWQLISVSGTAPASTAYCRIGVSMFRNGTDTIQVSGFQLNYTPQAAARAEMYEATQTSPGKSGSTEPVWPGAGLTVVDNEVTWDGVNIDRLVWQASPLLTSGTTEPDWPDAAGGVVHDGTIDWVAVVPYITDPNCPNTPIVAIMASKVFAADKDIVRFCATANASDWTSQLDAGYLPTGLQQANANDMAVLAPYRSNLTAFNASSFQNWQVDPDPAQMALLDQMEGIGSTYQHAAHPVGNELFYLSQLGVRSVSISAGSDNLQAGDVGMPVDSMVQHAIKDAAANGTKVLATYYPGAGQYWLSVSDYPPDVFSISGTLPGGATGVAVDFTYTLAGGVKPYGPVSVTAGSLPTGLVMDTSGHVTGTVTADGPYSWTVGATDALGTAASLPDSDSFYVPATFDAARNSNTTLSSNNTLATNTAVLLGGVALNTNKTSGKWYVEFSVVSGVSGNNSSCPFTSSNDADPVIYNGGSTIGTLELKSDGSYFDGGVFHGSGGLVWNTAGAVIGLAFDAGTRQAWFRNAGGWALGADPATAPSPFSALPDQGVGVTAGIGFNSGSQSVEMNAGQTPFAYSIPDGFSPLSTP